MCSFVQVLNESALTGESTPQLKEPLSSLSSALSTRLEMSKLKGSIALGGTKILGHGAGAQPRQLQPPGGAALGYVLRTGFGSSQGRLMRTILFSAERVSENNKEALLFILFLLCFAVAAAAHVLNEGLADPTRSRPKVIPMFPLCFSQMPESILATCHTLFFSLSLPPPDVIPLFSPHVTRMHLFFLKLILHCLMILTSVVPPELPMELSLAVNNSLMALHRMGIYCTEPFRIPLAGRLDACCFDKTGTLTSDNLVVEGVAAVGVATVQEGDPTDEQSTGLSPQLTSPALLPAAPTLETALNPNPIRMLSGCASRGPVYS